MKLNGLINIDNMSMQRGQKYVINLILLCLVLSTNYCKAQVNNDAYYLLDKIIEITRQPNDSTYILNRRNEVGKGFLRNYYDFRFNDRPFYTTFAYDSITDQVGYDTLKLEQNRIKWMAKYKVLDSVFTKADIEEVINSETTDSKWDSTNAIFNKKKDLTIKWYSGYYSKNFISKPYYNEDRNYLFIVYFHIKKGAETEIYIFKKEDEDWTIIDKIDNVGW